MHVASHTFSGHACRRYFGRQNYVTPDYAFLIVHKRHRPISYQEQRTTYAQMTNPSISPGNFPKYSGYRVSQQLFLRSAHLNRMTTLTMSDCYCTGQEVAVGGQANGYAELFIKLICGQTHTCTLQGN